jgi:hypothetical protein
MEKSSLSPNIILIDKGRGTCYPYIHEKERPDPFRQDKEVRGIA